ncbi:MAG: pyridoxal phosphate-dependent aminotransferase, partial [Bacteroidia bacterium]|nr:pyridoxal phosphate-dependent aminotransferase [Bacteroidia bacterium]
MTAQGLHLATQAREAAPHYEHHHLGYNYRMSNLLAGVGRGQMKVLEQRIQQRRANYAYYRQALADLPMLSFPEEWPGTFSNRWLTCVLTENYPQREQIRAALARENIESRPLW